MRVRPRGYLMYEVDEDGWLRSYSPKEPRRRWTLGRVRSLVRYPWAVRVYFTYRLRRGRILVVPQERFVDRGPAALWR